MRESGFSKGVVFTLLFILFAGCASEQSYLAKHSPAFVQGYKEGCKNAQERVADSFVEKKNDTARYKEDREYAKGWDDGYERCYGNAQMEQDLSIPEIFKE
ncbi:hypothetical protein [Hydrogenimonas sp.]